MRNHSFYNNISFSQNTTNYLIIPDQNLSLEAIMILLFTSMGMVLNTLIIVVIMWGSLMKTSVFMILLMVLAVADNVTLAFYILRDKETYTLLPFSHLPWLCCIVRFILYLSASVSSWLIVFISSERYIAVFHPLKAHIYCTRRNASFAILALLVLMSIIHIPIFPMSHITKKNLIYTCHGFGSSSLLAMLFSLLTVIVYSIIPFCIMSALNIQIVKRINSQRSFQAQHQQQSPPVQTKLIATMLAVCILFIVTTLPNGVLYILFSISNYTSSKFVSTGILTSFLMNRFWIGNHCVNFLLYCLTGSVFRQTLVRLLRCCKKHDSSSLVQRRCKTVQETVL